ncbi:glycoside hydrolase family 127 protein, partial [bacterium]
KDRGKAEEAVRKYEDYAQGRPSWGAYAQDDRPIFEQETIEGHAVRATLLLSAIAAAARVNGRKEYRDTAVRLWENMTFRRMHVTGGVGAYAQEEKFGEDYNLPNDAYLETCAAVGAGFFHANMNRTFGEARYADELERVLYNGVLCGISLAGDRYTYQNPLVADEGRERWAWHDCPCCPPMFLKIMGAMPGYVYATDPDSAYVNLFVVGHGSMKVKGTDLVLRQKTEYPWEGKVRIIVEPAIDTEFGLMLRVPTWCREAHVRVNGESISIANRVRGYVRIERTWRKGDVVELDLPMPVEAVRSHPKVQANIGRVAQMRGPLVYCLELPEAHSTTLSRRLGFATKREDGIVTIQVSTADARRVNAIPFFANGNQGPAKMAVWIPQEA